MPPRPAAATRSGSARSMRRPCARPPPPRSDAGAPPARTNYLSIVMYRRCMSLGCHDGDPRMRLFTNLPIALKILTALALMTILAIAVAAGAIRELERLNEITQKLAKNDA